MLALFVLAALSAAGLLRSLDAPYVRARVRALVKLPIDWQQTELSLTRGILLRGFSIASPAPFDAIAPELLHVDEVEVSWSLAKLLGKGPLAERIGVSGVRATIVVDAAGHDSLSALGGPSSPDDAPADGPALPRSHLLASIGARLPIEAARVKDAQVRYIQLGAQGRHQAEVNLDAEVELPKPNELSARLLVRLVAQDLIEELPAVHEVVQLTATASFQPAQGRLVIGVHGLRALDGALVGDLGVELPDEGAPRIGESQLALDTAPIQAAFSHTRSPLRLHGKAKIHARGLRVSALPAIEADGILEVDAKLDALALRLGKLRVEGEKLSLDLELRGPESHPVAAKAAKAHGAKVEPQLTPQSPASLLGAATMLLKAHRLEYDAGGLAIVLEGLALDAKADGIDPAAATALQLVHALHGKGQVERFDVRPGRLQVIGEGLRLDSDVMLPGAEPGSLMLDAPMARLAVALDGRPILGAISDDHSMTGDPAHIHAGLSGVRFDPKAPLAVQLAERSEVTLGPFVLRSQIDKTEPDAVRFDLDIAASNLGPLAGFVALPPGDSVPWSEVGAHLHTKGRLAGLPRVAAFELDHRTELELTRPRLRGSLPIAADRVAIAIASRGGISKHAGELSIAAEQLFVRERALGSPSLRGKLALDRGRPSIDVDLALDGGKTPQLTLRGSGTYDRRDRSLAYTLHLTATRLGLAAQLLPQGLVQRRKLDLDKLSLELDGKGRLREVITDFAGLVPRLAATPLEAARGDVELTLGVRGLDYEDVEGSQAVVIDALRLALTAEAGDEQGAARRRGKLGLTLDRGDLYLGEHAISIAGFQPTVAVELIGPLSAPELATEISLTLGKLVQDYYAPYPIGGLSLDAKLRSQPRGLVRVDRLELANQAGGTKLSLHGAIDASARAAADARPRKEARAELADRIGVDVELALEQALGSFSLGDGILASGTIKLPVHVQSGDLSLFSIRGALGMEDVHVALAGPAIEATGVDGRVPIALALVVEQRKLADGTTAPRVHLLPRADEISFPHPRFAEHQPFLAQRSFFKVEHLKIRTLEMGPIAGNLAIDDTRLELSQLEMRAAGGRVRGQLLAELDGEDTKLTFRGSVTGLMPPGSHGRDNRLDANLSIVTQPLRLAIEGRTELVHISRRLLLDLLDAWDPYHAESAANRARKALDVGYPESVRLSFAHGFASLRLQLGGLTSAVRIDEIKGMAVGPLLERYVGDSMRGLLVDDTVQERNP